VTVTFTQLQNRWFSRLILFFLISAIIGLAIFFFVPIDPFLDTQIVENINSYLFALNIGLIVFGILGLFMVLIFLLLKRLNTIKIEIIPPKTEDEAKIPIRVWTLLNVMIAISIAALPLFYMEISESILFPTILTVLLLVLFSLFMSRQSMTTALYVSMAIFIVFGLLIALNSYLSIPLPFIEDLISILESSLYVQDFSKFITGTVLTLTLFGFLGVFLFSFILIRAQQKVFTIIETEKGEFNQNAKWVDVWIGLLILLFGLSVAFIPLIRPGSAVLSFPGLVTGALLSTFGVFVSKSSFTEPVKDYRRVSSSEKEKNESPNNN
jgi:hypothetical protein